MRATIKKAPEGAWYKDLIGKTLEVTQNKEFNVKVFMADQLNAELIRFEVARGAIKKEEVFFIIDPNDCEMLDAMGFIIEPCKFCKCLGKRWRGEVICPTCGEARQAIANVLKLPKGKEALKKILEPTGVMSKAAGGTDAGGTDAKD